MDLKILSENQYSRIVHLTKENEALIERTKKLNVCFYIGTTRDCIR